jgi:hypothetical protein
MLGDDVAEVLGVTHYEPTVCGNATGGQSESPPRIPTPTYDLFHEGQWLGHSAARLITPTVPWVPVIAGPIPFDFDRLCEFAEGQTTLPGADHVREGVVIVPEVERYDERIGRVKLKLVGAGYLQS